MKIENLTLPINRAEVADFSTISTLQRCGIKGFMQYGINRAPLGTNYPIQFGVAYHKFREILENIYSKAVNFDGHSSKDLISNNDWRKKAFDVAWSVASLNWEDPPLDHKKAYLTISRLETACSKSFDNWLHEKSTGRFKVLFTEQAFNLELAPGRWFGGRFDQILEWNGRLWVRDYKTVSRMGSSYSDQFEPNNQMTGYVWAAQELSGRQVEGVIIDVVYNTKNQGPDFFEFLTTRTTEHIERWKQTTIFEMNEIDRMFEEMNFPMRTGACADYGGCFFRDCCKKSAWSSMEEWLRTHTTESQWDFMNPDKEEGVVD